LRPLPPAYPGRCYGYGDGDGDNDGVLCGDGDGDGVPCGRLGIARSSEEQAEAAHQGFP
jgi:hypothetical protein